MTSRPIAIGLLVVGTLVLLILASWGLTKKGKKKDLDYIIRVLYRQCGRWAMAAEQDHSEVVRLLHANYATGYLWAIKDIATTEDFKRATGGQDYLSFEGEIVRVQDSATRALVAACPSVATGVSPLLLRAAYTYPEETGPEA